MKVIVTGHAGFIGRALVRALVARGHGVVGFDTRAAAPETARDAWELGEMSLAGVDVLFHLAAKVGVQTAAREGVTVLQENTGLTQRVLSVVAVYAPKIRVIIASSSEVYGDARAQPCHEDMPLALPPPVDPRWGYTYGKAADEALALGLMAARRIGVVAVARLFNVCGPGQNRNYGAVLPAFVEAAVAGKPVPVHGDGFQTRSFLHVDDTVAGLIALAEAPAPPPIVNVGGDDEICMHELAWRVKDVLGSSSPVEFVGVDSAISGCRRRVADTTRLRALGWAPKKTLDDAIRELAAEIRG